MMDEQLVLRMATALTKISLNQLRSAHKLEREQFQDQLKELKRLETLKVYQRKSDARTIEATIRHLVKKWGLQVVFIDYVQLMEPFDTKDNREQQVARMSRMLKRLTREYRILIFALAQINKDHEKEKRKPRASDLRESQSLRQDADGCYFVYKPAENFQGFEQQPDATTYDVMYYNDKNRNNATGQTVWLRFFADIQLMKEIDMSQK
jgi:replicative DNA helicase